MLARAFHAGLPTAPAVGEPSLDCLPVLGRDRACAGLVGALLELRDPSLDRVGIGAVVQAQQQLVGEFGALPDGEGEGVGEQVGGLGCHGTSLATGG
jgi:hypothetical protein